MFFLKLDWLEYFRISICGPLVFGLVVQWPSSSDHHTFASLGGPPASLKLRALASQSSM